MIKFTIEQATKAQTGSTVKALIFLDPWRYMGGGVSDQRHVPAALPPGQRPGTHCTGGWVGPRAVLYGRRKSPHPPGFDCRFD